MIRQIATLLCTATIAATLGGCCSPRTGETPHDALTPHEQQVLSFLIQKTEEQSAKVEAAKRRLAQLERDGAAEEETRKASAELEHEKAILVPLEAKLAEEKQDLMSKRK